LVGAVESVDVAVWNNAAHPNYRYYLSGLLVLGIVLS